MYMSECGHVCATVHIWGSEEIFPVSRQLSPSTVGPRDQIQVTGLFGKCLYPLVIALDLAQVFEFTVACRMSMAVFWGVGLVCLVGGWVDGFSFEQGSLTFVIFLPQPPECCKACTTTCLRTGFMVWNSLGFSTFQKAHRFWALAKFTKMPPSPSLERANTIGQCPVC